MSDSYPHLAPELLALADGFRRIWGDAGTRATALADIAAAWERSDRPALATAVARIDGAVAAGLVALGLPRGPVIGVSVERVGRGWLGRKRPDCHLILDGDVLTSALRAQQLPDEIFRTWVHESLHARQPYSLPAAELRDFRGYEEGMVEGLARTVTRDKAEMLTLNASYAYYVVAYRAVAAMTGVDVEALWRALWTYPTGEVRARFVGVVNQMRNATMGQRMTPRQRDRLQGLADRAFASRNSLALDAEQAVLERAFELVFR